MTAEIKDKVRAFVLDSFMMGSEADIPDDISFMDNHIIDSTGFLELIMFIEQTFHIKVTDSEMVPENLDSLNSIERYLAMKLAK
jgi:acyl carrier protein